MFSTLTLKTSIPKLITYFLWTPAVLLYYLIQPLTHDVRIFFGVAKLADTLGGFPAGVDLAYEAKPIGNKILFYGLYKIFSPVWQDKILFALGVKGLVAVIALITIWYFSRGVAKRFRIEQYQVSLITVVALFTCSDFVLFQPEWFCAIIGIMILTLLMSESSFAWFAAGLLMIPVFLIKGVSGFYCITFLLAAVLLIPDFRRRIGDIVFGAVIAGSGSIAVIPAVFPHFIGDVTMISHISGIINPGLFDRIHYTIATALTLNYAVPAVIISLLCLAMLVIYYLKARCIGIGIVLLAMWGITIVPAAIQSEYYTYHFAVLTVTSIITCIMFIDLIYEADKKRIMTIVIVGAILVLCAISFQQYSWHTNYWETRDKDAKEIDLAFNVSNQSKVLYLDLGDAPWYYSAQSACRQSPPFLLYFNDSRHDLRTLPEYNELVTCIRDYRGEYIVATDSWLFLNESSRKELADKLTIDYVKVWNRSFDVYRKKDQILFNAASPSLSSSARVYPARAAK